MRILITLLIYFVVLTSQGVFASKDFYNTYLPKDVKLGMSVEEVQNCRPNALSREIEGRFIMMETMMNNGILYAYGYQFKDLKLRSISYSFLIMTGMTENTETDNIYADLNLNKDFIKQSDQKIIRVRILKPYIVTAELWENKTTGFQIYFVSTNAETTLILFDPEYMGKNDFFASPYPKMWEDHERQKEGIEKMIKMHKEENQDKGEPSQYEEPPEDEVPVIDRPRKKLPEEKPSNTE